ncbi:hypothetical protein MHM582_1502 [Microbacterium sp. HM58-2]|nr:hypothetical protein MHM582_1502 [Microbacterium sp. HM58-2]
MYKPLNDDQLAVLRWVGDGRPQGVYEDGYEHRITARALERRGLVKVSGHGRSWTATLTAGGRYYLGHGAYEPEDHHEHGEAGHTPRRRSRPAQPEPTPTIVDDLLQRLRRNDGALRLDSPSEADRIGYRQAVEHARASGDLAFEEQLKLTGTKRGPLIVELVQRTVADTPKIAVPNEADPHHSAVRAASNRLRSVSDEARPRALTLIQGIADECTRRSWSMVFDDEPGFAVTIGDDTYRCRLFEEMEKRDVYTDEDVAARKYDWQRVSATRKNVYSGRLRLEVGQGYGSAWWADRKRWTLASKLPDYFDTLEEKSSAARERRARVEQAHRDNLAAWEEAVPRARERYVRALNVERAHAQISEWKRANELRAYADAIATHLEGMPEEAEPDSIIEWLAWLRAEAERIDPLADHSELRVDSPTEIRVADLDKHMPNGWTSRRPPDPPTWLPT